MLDDIFFYDDIDFTKNTNETENAENHIPDFVSEILKDSTSQNESDENNNFNMTFSVQSDFNDFQDPVWDKSPLTFFPSNDIKCQNVESTNDEMNFFNQYFENELNNSQNKNSISENLFRPESNVHLNKTGENIFIEPGIKCDSVFSDKHIFTREPVEETMSKNNEQQNKVADSTELFGCPLEIEKAPVKINFGNLKKILTHVFMGDSVPLRGIPKLHFEEKWIIDLFFTKIFKGKVKFSDYNYNFNYLKKKIEKMKSNRSSEELIKKIYRPFFRKMFEQFKGIYNFHREDLRRKKSCPILYDDKMKTFFCFLFEDSEKRYQKEFDTDLMLDILTERTKSLVYSNKILLKKDNWRTVKKAKFPKKISRSLRYLVKINELTRARFEDFLNCYLKKKFIKDLKEKICSDLFEKINKIKKLHEESGNDFEDFKDKVSKMIFHRSFKLQWPLWEVMEAVNYCRNDFDNPKLQREFLIIKSKHYSS